MSRDKIIIAHCTSNGDIAKEIAHQLQYSNFDFDLVACGEDGQSIQTSLADANDNIILLLSDNFLKSVPCMDGGLAYLQKLVNAGKTLPVVIDGKYPNQDGKGFVAVPTKFERVSSVIKYMNYWQDEYLEMRKQKRSVAAEKEEAFASRLKIVRAISSEVGEFLRFLRDSYTCDYDTFKAENFQIFFQKYSDQLSYTAFSEQVAKNPISSILGTSMALGSVAAASSMVAKTVVEEKIAVNTPEETISSKVQEIATPKEEVIEQIEVAELTEVVAEEQPIQPSQELEKMAEPITVDLQAADISLSEKEAKIDGLVDEILQEEATSNNEQADINDTELLAQELAQNLPDSGLPTPVTEEPEELIDVETALEDLSKQQIEDLSNQQIAQEEAIMQDGLDMLGVTAATGTAAAIKFSGQEQTVAAPKKQLISESDLLRTSHELVQQGKVGDGLSLLVSNLESRPDMIAARYQYSVFLAQFRNDYKGASDQLKKILEIEPTNLPANFFLGELAEAQRDFYGAKTYYEAVEKSNPDFPNLHYRLGLLLGRRFKDQAASAAYHLHEAYAQNPRNIDALYNWGLVKNEALNEPKAALSAFMKVAAEDVRHPFVNYDLALAYYKLNDRVQAFKYYGKASAINPELQTPENDLAFAIPEEVVETTTIIEEESSDAEMLLEEKILDQEISALVMEEPKATTPAENPDYTLDLTSKEEILLEDLIIDDSSPEIVEKQVGKIVDEEKLEAEFDATIGALGAAGLGIAAGAAIEKEQEPEQEKTDQPTTEVTVKKVKMPTEIVMITGATSGIGRATAALFAEHGYDLILTGRRFSRLLQLKEEFEKQYSSNIQLLPFDVRSSAAVQSAIEELPKAWKNVNILINNAGLALGFEPIHEGSLEDWETMIDTNVKGLLYMTRTIAPFMVKQKKGHIINISSIAGKEVYPNGNVYCASKHAVEALTKAMRIDLHKHNIRVSQIAPGHVEETEFAKVRFHGDKERAKIYEDFVPVNSRDIAETIYFVATRPPHVNIQDVLIMGTQQASAMVTDRSGRE